MKIHLESSTTRLSGSFTSFLLLFALTSLVMAVALACGGGSPSDNPLELILDDVRGVVVLDFEQIRAGGAPDQAADSLESAWNTELDPLNQSQGGNYMDSGIKTGLRVSEEFLGGFSFMYFSPWC